MATVFAANVVQKLKSGRWAFQAASAAIGTAQLEVSLDGTTWTAITAAVVGNAATAFGVESLPSASYRANITGDATFLVSEMGRFTK